MEDIVTSSFKKIRRVEALMFAHEDRRDFLEEEEKNIFHSRIDFNIEAECILPTKTATTLKPIFCFKVYLSIIPV